MKRIKLFPDYSITRKGKVISHKWGKKTYLKLRYFKRAGYYYVTLLNGEIRKNLRVHILVAKAFVKNPNKKKNKIVNHKDGDKLNNNDWNLEWTTTRENMRHASKMGLLSKGENHGSSKLTWEIVKIIRASNKSHSALGREFNVSHTLISNVRNNKTWVV